MNRKIVLIHKWFTPGVAEFPLGLAYLASYLESYLGIKNVKIISKDYGLEEEVLNCDPELIGFYAYTAQIEDIVRIAKKLKRSLDVPFLIGGPHISSLPKELPEVFTLGVIGEGEETFKEIVELYYQTGRLPPEKLAKIKGIVFHQGGRKIITSPREMIKNIDQIPFPARHLFDRQLLLKPGDALFRYEKKTCLDIFTVRGCPYQCAFCQQPTFGHTLRLHSAQYVVNEIEHVYQKYRPENILSLIHI